MSPQEEKHMYDGRLLENIARTSSSWREIIERIEARGFRFEFYNLSTGSEILIHSPTGESDNILGYSIQQTLEPQKGFIVTETYKI